MRYKENKGKDKYEWKQADNQADKIKEQQKIIESLKNQIQNDRRKYHKLMEDFH